MKMTLNLILLHGALAWVLALSDEPLGMIAALGVGLLATLVYIARILAEATSRLSDDLSAQTDRITREIDALRQQPMKDAANE